jgi:murein DD-endopeptidase MepM/ murein hydrolase activator NlpD
MPLFRRPFDGEGAVTNVFDHGPVDGRLVSATGRPAYGELGHRGYDFLVPRGTELRAMADGVVALAGDRGPKRCNGGNRVPDDIEVWIVHDPAPDGFRYQTRLQHLARALVAVGDRVTAGQVVARSGDSGCSSQPHLHLQVERVPDETGRHGIPVDPYGWSGEGPDPRPIPSRWMWLDGEAPRVRHGATGGLSADAEVGPHHLIGTDLVDPIGGELVDVGVRATATRGYDLGGWTLRNGRGDALTLPPVHLDPGQDLRIWTRRAEVGPSEVSWGLDREAWDDVGDCASLLDPDGRLVGQLSFGRGQGRCAGAPEVPDDPE